MKFAKAFYLALVAFVHPLSAEYQLSATMWVVEDEFSSGNFVLAGIRYGLACLYYATYNVDNEYVANIGPWVDATNWMKHTDHCTWYGITCDSSGIITELDLASNNVGGYFPQEISIFAPGILLMDLSDNPIASVGGDLSWMGSLKKIMYLDLHYANIDYFGIPPYFQELVNLEYLDTSDCYFYGDLDGEPFAKMTNLAYLDLGGNYFVGQSLPAEIASLPNLERLYMDYSGLGGDLSWITLVNRDLFELWLDHNNLEGSIPSEIGEVTGLGSLSLSSCSLTGTLPSQMGDLTLMQQMWFHNNSLVGTIPASIGKLYFLEIFQTEDTLIGGEMPQEVCRLKDFQLNWLSTDCSGGAQADVFCLENCCDCCESPC